MLAVVAAGRRRQMARLVAPVQTAADDSTAVVNGTPTKLNASLESCADPSEVNSKIVLCTS
jgi:hypothetical protein